jgi:hypothetical protein
VFSLCPHPVFEPFSSQLTLGALVPFMDRCPNLTSLSLWIDATRLPSISFYQLSSSRLSPIRFGTAFRTLDIASSPITPIDATLVANYLAHYFPEYTPMYTDPDESFSRDVYRPRLRTAGIFGYGEHRRRLQVWKQIASRLPDLVQSRCAPSP